MILVTGATGFLGRNVVRALRARGKDVRCLVRDPSRASVLSEYDVELARGDVLDPSALGEAMAGVEVVVHLVAIIREQGTATFDLINRQGTEMVLEAARAQGVRRFVHISAIGAQDSLRYPYLHSKWRGEQAVIGSGINYTILRPSILFGEGDEFINALAGVVKASPIVPVAGPGEVLLQPVSVEDVSAMVAEVVDNPRFDGRTVEVGGPAHLTYNEIVSIIVRTMKLRRLRAHLPVPVMKRIVGLMEALVPHPPATRSQLELLALDNVTDLDSVEREFGMTPRPLEGNIGYIERLSWWDAARTTAGFMPKTLRDH